jgi:hypothetical protein
MTKTVQLSSRIVVRHEDSLIFDPRTFTVHKLSPTALELISLFEKSSRAVDDVIAQATALQFDPDHVHEFIQLAVEAGFLETQ